MFEFGFGLSYTTFTYSSTSTSRTTCRAAVPSSLYVTVADSSPLLETEIQQLYLRYAPSSSKLLVHLL